MSHEKPCCGLVCACDGEDTWNDPGVCVQADDACEDCQEKRAQDDEPECPGCGHPGSNETCPACTAVLDRLVAEERVNNIRLAQNNKGTCPLAFCQARVGETREGRWFHLTGPDAGGRACFDEDATETGGAGRG